MPNLIFPTFFVRFAVLFPVAVTFKRHQDRLQRVLTMAGGQVAGSKVRPSVLQAPVVLFQPLLVLSWKSPTCSGSHAPVRSGCKASLTRGLWGLGVRFLHFFGTSFSYPKWLSEMHRNAGSIWIPFFRDRISVEVSPCFPTPIDCSKGLRATQERHQSRAQLVGQLLRLLRGAHLESLFVLLCQRTGTSVLRKRSINMRHDMSKSSQSFGFPQDWTTRWMIG